VLWGDGDGPQNVSKAAPTGPIVQRSAPAERVDEPHGRFPVRIAKALEADLSHNEFGQWSSVEVQHTVIWALKDLARRLWVLRFDMSKTFELTDDCAARIGLPVRPADGSSDEGDSAPGRAYGTANHRHPS